MVPVDSVQGIRAGTLDHDNGLLLALVNLLGFLLDVLELTRCAPLGILFPVYVCGVYSRRLIDTYGRVLNPLACFLREAALELREQSRLGLVITRRAELLLVKMLHHLHLGSMSGYARVVQGLRQ